MCEIYDTLCIYTSFSYMNVSVDPNTLIIHTHIITHKSLPGQWVSINNNCVDYFIFVHNVTMSSQFTACTNAHGLVLSLVLMFMTLTPFPRLLICIFPMCCYVRSFHTFYLQPFITFSKRMTCSHIQYVLQDSSAMPSVPSSKTILTQ